MTRWTQQQLDQLDASRVRDQATAPGAPARRRLHAAREPTMSEADLQDAVVGWARSARAPAGSEHLIHIHNEAAGKTRTSGIRPGVPDLFLPVQRGDYAGLWLELKRPAADNDLTGAQNAEMRRLLCEGYATEVAWTFRQAQAAIRCYLTDPDSLLPGY